MILPSSLANAKVTFLQNPCAQNVPEFHCTEALQPWFSTYSNSDKALNDDSLSYKQRNHTKSPWKGYSFYFASTHQGCKGASMDIIWPSSWNKHHWTDHHFPVPSLQSTSLRTTNQKQGFRSFWKRVINHCSLLRTDKISFHGSVRRVGWLIIVLEVETVVLPTTVPSHCSCSGTTLTFEKVWAVKVPCLGLKV